MNMASITIIKRGFIYGNMLYQKTGYKPNIEELMISILY